MIFNKAFIMTHLINIRGTTIVWLVYDRDVHRCTMEDIPPELIVDFIDINKMRDNWIVEITLYLEHSSQNKEIYNKIVEAGA